MLKAYAIEDLKPGMVVGRDVMDHNGEPLINVGAVLTNEMIFDLLDRPIFSIYIDEDADDMAAISIPARDHLLDDSYVTEYAGLYDQVVVLFEQLRAGAPLDVQAVTAAMEPLQHKGLCKGVKAVSQIHNMKRSGDYLVHHCLHVAILAGLMGNREKWPKDKIYDIMLAGLLIDCGKTRIAPEILNKQGKLTDEEFAEIRQHPVYGYELIKESSLGSKRDILMGVLQHHERSDGAGYPYGSVQDEISVMGRILGILDIYDAMAADKSYAKRKSPFDIFAIIYDDILAGKLDPTYGVKFIRHLCQDLNGNWVALSNGEKGRIVYIDPSRVSSMPIVQTAHGKFVDLNTVRDVRIEAILTADEAMED